MNARAPDVLDEIRKTTGINSPRLGGKSPNAHWHIPRALHSALGEIEAVAHLITLCEPYLNYRLREGVEDARELGVVSSAVFNAAIVAEKSLKTLLALEAVGSRPVRRHSLKDLFDMLKPETQEAVRTAFRAITKRNKEYWDNDDVDSVLSIASTSFVDWRYTMEPKETTGGIPKGVLLAAIAIICVGIELLTDWQANRA